MTYLHLTPEMTQIIPMTSAVSGLASPQICVSGSTLIGQPGSQHPPPTPTLVTTPVLLTPRIAPYFPPPGVLTRTSMMNPGQQVMMILMMIMMTVMMMMMMMIVVAMFVYHLHTHVYFLFIV